MLGRHIGYKALENRLHQMWDMRGIINIVDLGQDFFLVTFTSEEDQEFAILEGPWMIYDHYLTVRVRSTNFYPKGDVIKNLAIWVRIAGLPI